MSYNPQVTSPENQNSSNKQKKNSETDSKSHELSPRTLEYPIEYFRAQVELAFKWAEIAKEPVDQALLNKTTVYRRLVGERVGENSSLDPLWEVIAAEARKATSPEALTFFLYEMYRSGLGADPFYREKVYPENDGVHFGYFSFERINKSEKHGGRDIIELHFTNLKRGQSGLSRSMAEEHVAAMKRMFVHIKKIYPNEKLLVVGETWLYNIPHFRALRPPEYFIHGGSIDPQEIHELFGKPNAIYFDGNAYWGQFVNRGGAVQQEVFDYFMENIQKARTLQDILHAFKYVPQRYQSEIEVFYDFFKVDEVS